MVKAHGSHKDGPDDSNPSVTGFRQQSGSGEVWAGARRLDQTHVCPSPSSVMFGRCTQ